MGPNSWTRNVVLRRRKQINNPIVLPDNDILQTNSTPKDDALIQEIKNEYKTIPPEYLQTPRKSTTKVSFTRQMSLGEISIF